MQLPDEPPAFLREEGNCRDLDTSIFYPVTGDFLRPAMKACATCPVYVECAEWAIRKTEYGIWGGLTDADRKDIRSRRKNGVIPFPEDQIHGDAKVSVRAHIEAGEVPCIVCHRAWAGNYPNYKVK